jgi:hypothetical protein
MGLAVYDEYLASLVAVPAAAFAIDAWYIEVMDRIPFVPSQPPPSNRFGWVWGTLSKGFAPGRASNAWAQAIKRLYKLRDDVAHFRSEWLPLQPHPSGRTHVSAQNVIYSAEEAERSALIAVEVICGCLRNPRPTNVELVEWCEARPHVAGDLEALRDRILARAPEVSHEPVAPRHTDEGDSSRPVRERTAGLVDPPPV